MELKFLDSVKTILSQLLELKNSVKDWRVIILIIMFIVSMFFLLSFSSCGLVRDISGQSTINRCDSIRIYYGKTYPIAPIGD